MIYDLHLFKFGEIKRETLKIDGITCYFKFNGMVIKHRN